MPHKLYSIGTKSFHPQVAGPQTVANPKIFIFPQFILIKKFDWLKKKISQMRY
jgi:hypothetical protein